MHTKIIATIGPASSSEDTLQFFKEHGVEFARLNFSHGSSDWHRSTAQLCRKVGLKVLFDLSGPKTRLGELAHTIEVSKNNEIILEYVQNEQVYPYPSYNSGKETMVLPCSFVVQDFVQIGSTLYIDDGKIKLQVKDIKDNRVYCDIINGGVVKSNKGVNIPGTDPKISFLTDRDRHLLAELFADIRPDMVAISFVRYAQDIFAIKEYLQELIKVHGISDYFPLICSKIEQQQAVTSEHFRGILENSDVIMVARGDLALETEPIHVMVPFYQKQIVELCQTNQTPFIIATQVLESMITSQTPTRAEISDLYRAVVEDEADYVMLSAETAAGQYPREAIKIMHHMCSEYKDLENKAKKDLGNVLPVRITYSNQQVK